MKTSAEVLVRYCGTVILVMLCDVVVLLISLFIIEYTACPCGAQCEMYVIVMLFNVVF
jgi:hypothetical protein